MNEQEQLMDNLLNVDLEIIDVVAGKCLRVLALQCQHHLVCGDVAAGSQPLGNRPQGLVTLDRAIAVC